MVRSIVMGVVAVGISSVAMAAPVIGGFDLARGGEGSWASGAWPTNARTSVVNNFAGASFSATNVLTSEYLAGLDIVILTSARNANGATAALSGDEQAALSGFVAAGGRAIIISDNSAFDPNATVVNNSLLAPFGATASGTLNFGQTASMTLANNPVASGPFGSVSSVQFFYPGWLNTYTVGTPIARLDANNEVGGLLIDTGELGAGSGRVAIFTDTYAFDFTAGSNNEIAFLNTVHWLLVPTPASVLPLIGAGLLASRRCRSTVEHS